MARTTDSNYGLRHVLSSTCSIRGVVCCHQRPSPSPCTQYAAISARCPRGAPPSASIAFTMVYTAGSNRHSRDASSPCVPIGNHWPRAPPSATVAIVHRRGSVVHRHQRLPPSSCTPPPSTTATFVMPLRRASPSGTTGRVHRLRLLSPLCTAVARACTAVSGCRLRRARHRHQRLSPL